jgi:hypothetical protein
MRNRVLSLMGAAVLALAGAAPALAGPPTRFSEPILFSFPDTTLGLVVLINIDRASICTPEQIAFEEALIDWLEGGEVGEPPEPPADPEGFDLVSFQQLETGQGAVVQLFKASGLYVEIWEMDADAPLVGPCTDTDDAMHLIGSGTARFIANDNDLFFSDTRANAFGDRGIANISDDEGNRFRYSWMFHINSRCFAPEDGPPACLIQRSSLQAR